MELTKGDAEALAKVRGVDKEYITKRLMRAYELGNVQCSECGLTSGVWRLTLYNIVNKETGEVKKVCPICGIKYTKGDK